MGLAVETQDLENHSIEYAEDVERRADLDIDLDCLEGIVLNMKAGGLVLTADIDPVALDRVVDGTVPLVDIAPDDLGRLGEGIVPGLVDLVRSTLNRFSCHFLALATLE